MLRRTTVNNVIYSRTVSYPDQENSPRVMAWIGLTEEANRYGLFEEIRLDGETEETKFVCWHFKWDRAGAIEHAVEYIRNKQQHGMQQQKYRAPRRPRNLSLWARAGRDDGRRWPASAASRGRAPVSPFHSNLRS